MHNDISAKEREKAEAIRPKVGAEKGPFYQVTEINRPSVLSLLGLVEVLEEEQERPKITI